MKAELPKTCTQDMYVHLCEWSKDQVILFSCDMSEHGNICLGKVSITFDVPQTDIIAAKISSLEQQIKKAGERHQQIIIPLKRQIKELQAITHQV